MKRSLILAPVALVAFLSASTAEQSRDPETSSQPGRQAIQGGLQQSGGAFGTVVLWNHYHSGLPTGHLQGRLLDGARVIAEVYARLEDDGDVTGYARTLTGPRSIEGEWELDGEEGEFEIDIELENDLEYDIEGEFEGWRTIWSGEWELTD